MTIASIMQIMWNLCPLLYDGIPKTQFCQLFLCLVGRYILINPHIQGNKYFKETTIRFGRDAQFL